MNRRRLLQSIAAVVIPSVKARPEVVAPIVAQPVHVVLEYDGRQIAEFFSATDYILRRLDAR